MKVERIELEKKEEFKPFTIQITFENEVEARVFYNIFNYSPICDHLHRYGFSHRLVAEAIRTPMHADIFEYGKGWIDWVKEFEKDLKIKND